MVQSTNNLLNNSIAERIKTLRQERNITLEVFYFDTGIHLARIEQGKTNITVSTLNRICEYFEVKLSSFFKDIEESKI